ncbi:ABC transporter substrate-binding protein [Butyrivibrio proteoclasticus]|uniref:ABC transporter substrate-binding protein n=1 Tax=Butyrivibrio proteoclasticus TaxID=43305 RepID=UPI0018CBF9AE|nr:extracellular solute-binding protein [Butyrivibrio proteoclasticus]
MKMRRFIKKGLCLSLATVLAVSTYGCGKKSGSDDSILNEASKSSKDYVFATEIYDFAEDMSKINRVSNVGDRVYASTYNIDDHIEIYSFNSDGSDVETVKIPCTENENFAYISFDADGNIYGIDNVYSWSYEDEDGEMHIYDDAETPESSDLENSADVEASLTEEPTASASAEATEITEAAEDVSEGEASEDVSSEDDFDSKMMPEESGDDEIYLVKYDKDGNLLEKVDLKAEFPQEEYISVNSFAVTDDGTCIMSLEQGIISYSSDKGFKKIIENKSTSDYLYYQLYKGFKGQLFVSYYDDNGNNLCTFDPESGTIGTPSKAITAYSEKSFFGGNGYDLYMSDSNGIFGYDIASDSMTKLVDYIDSDIESSGSIPSAAAISDGEFVACLPDADYNFYLARLTKVAPEDVKEKKIITLGGNYIDYDVRKLAFAFNKNNSEYKIKFVDYSSYATEENYNAGSEKLNMDIISGNTPDILVISDDLPVDSYINKGLFTDLTHYLQNDPDITENDMITNIVDAFKTGDKLYQLVPSFYFSTMIMKSKYAEGRDYLTFKDCDELMKSMGSNKQTAFGLETREGFLEQGIRYSGNTYIDWENKTCHFDSESFIEFLEFSKDFVEEYPDNVWEDYKDTLYRTDDALFCIMSFSDFREYQYWKQGMFGTDISFVGYPNDMGINNSIIYPSKRLAISSQSKNKDAAWEYLKMFLTEEYQDDCYCFPIRKSSYDKKAEEITNKPYYIEDGKKVEYEDTCYIGGQDIPLKPLSKDEVLEVTNFIKSLTLVNNYNSNVNNIIFEEASAYYSGQKSAKETADIIQSRLSIYVNENS